MQIVSRIDGHAVFPQGMNRVAGRFLRWIKESKEADEHHVLLIRRGELPFRRGICLLRNGNHAHTAAVELICLAQDVGAHLVRQRNDFSLAFRMGAARQHLLHRALGNQLGLALAVAHNNAHAAALEVKRDFVHLLEAGNQLIRAKLTLFVDDSNVNQVLEARLEVAVQERVAQHAVVRLAVYVQVIFQHHLVLRERTSLVRAEDVHCAEVLNRVQVLDDDLLAAHGHGALRQRGGHNHRQHFRRQTDGNRNGEQPRLNPVAVAQTVDEQHNRHHQEHEANQHPRNAVDTLLKGGLRRLDVQRLCHCAEHRVMPDGEDDRRCAAADDRAAHERQIAAFGQAANRLADCAGLLHRLTFPSQAGLAEEQVLRAEDAHVRREHVARRQRHDVAHDDFFQRDFLLLALARHADCRVNHLGELRRDIAAAGLLHEAENAGN